jgi:hypothetical protein
LVKIERGGGHRFLELHPRDVASRLDDQKLAFQPKSLSDLGEEDGLLRNLMHHAKTCDKVYLTGKTLEPQSPRFAQAKVDPVEKKSLFRSAPQHSEHLLLEIDGGHSAVEPYHTCEGKREKAHTTAGLEDGHPFADERTEYLVRMFNEPS